MTRAKQDRLRVDRTGVLHVIADSAVPSTDAQAGRNVRMTRVKASGGFRTWAGAGIAAALRSALSTRTPGGPELRSPLGGAGA